MKKIKGPISEHIKPVKLYLNDLEAILVSLPPFLDKFHAEIRWYSAFSE